MENLMAMVELVDREFGEMKKNGKFRSKDDVELVYKMMDIVKDAFQAMKCENEIFGGYSETGMYPTYPYEGNSYARGRSMPRNSMGQFTSRDGGYGYDTNNSYRGMNYSRTDAKSEFLDHLYSMMNNAPTEQMRDRMQKMIHEMEQQ